MHFTFRIYSSEADDALLPLEQSTENYRFISFTLHLKTFASFLMVSVTVCYQGGVQRVHLLDGTIAGVLLKELYQRDGVGTMVARFVVI